jgi:hypothetical protein
MAAVDCFKWLDDVQCLCSALLKHDVQQQLWHCQALAAELLNLRDVQHIMSRDCNCFTVKHVFAQTLVELFNG